MSKIGSCVLNDPERKMISCHGNEDKHSQFNKKGLCVLCIIKQKD